MENAQKNAENFNCELCHFKCSKKCDYERHILTLKHENRTFSNNIEQKNADLFCCKYCPKTYYARNSLWYHEKKCRLTKKNAEKMPHENEKLLDEKEIIVTLLQQNNTLQAQLLELCKEKSSITNINNTGPQIISNNKTFNLNVFLKVNVK